MQCSGNQESPAFRHGECQAQSNLAKLGDVVLTGMGREVHYSSESVASRLIHMAITDVLYTAMARSNPESYHDNIAKMRSVIADTRE